MNRLRALLVVLVNLVPSTADAHGGEGLLCLPFVWALECYVGCVTACLSCVSPPRPGPAPHEQEPTPREEQEQGHPPEEPRTTPTVSAMAH